MTAIQFLYDWVELGPATEAREVQVTFAQLTVRAGDEPISRLFDIRSRTTRDFAVVPLYPVAEWIVANWWSLLHEPEVPSRGIASADYQRRHDLRSARDGYALPPLSFHPEGNNTRVSWRPPLHSSDSVRFLESGSAHVPTAALRQAFTDLVDAVISRLHDHGIADTWLQTEWLALQQSDPEEQQFCLTAGWLGLDPFDLPENESLDLLDSAAQLPEPLREEVLKASPPDRVRDAAAWVQDGLRAIETYATPDGQWSQLRRRIPPHIVAGPPWKVGYQLAGELRDLLHLGDTPLVDLDALVGSPFPLIAAPLPPSLSFDGIAGIGPTGFCAYSPKARPDSQRFFCARALLAFLFDHAGEPLFYSSAHTEFQQRSRAFAAEFLAPAHLLRQRLSGDDIAPEEVEQLAADFHVSSVVIERQIRNHHLGHISP